MFGGDRITVCLQIIRNRTPDHGTNLPLSALTHPFKSRINWNHRELENVTIWVSDLFFILVHVLELCRNTYCKQNPNYLMLRDRLHQGQNMSAAFTCFVLFFPLLWCCPSLENQWRINKDISSTADLPGHFFSALWRVMNLCSHCTRIKLLSA